MNTETATKRDGFERVRECILCRIDDRENAADPWVKIKAEEIAAGIGISPQAVNKHIRALVDSGVLARERRFYFHYGPTVDIESRFLRNQNAVSESDFQVSQKPSASGQESFSETSGSFSETKKGFSETYNMNIIYEYENENENESENLEKDSSDCDICRFGLLPGDGLLRTGMPSRAAEIGRFIDWSHPKAREVIRRVQRIFPYAVQCRDWSPDLTRYVACGMIYVLPGFLDEDLLKVSSYIKEQESAVREWDATNPGFRKTAKPNDVSWKIVGSYVKRHFSGIIAYDPCEPPRKERNAQKAGEVREAIRQGVFAEVEAEPLYEKDSESGPRKMTPEESVQWENLKKKYPQFYKPPESASPTPIEVLETVFGGTK